MRESLFISLTPRTIEWCGKAKAFRNSFTMEDLSDEEQALSVAAEIAVAQFLGMTGEAFAASYKLKGYHDVQTQTGLKVDVKSSSHAGAKRLIWPVSKNEDFERRHFDVLVFCRTRDLPIVELVGWVFKQEFATRRHVADGTDLPKAGTWYMEEGELRDMETLPGSLTAARLGVGAFAA